MGLFAQILMMVGLSWCCCGGWMGAGGRVLGRIAGMGLFAQILLMGGFGGCCGGTGVVPRVRLGAPMAVLQQMSRMGLFAQIFR